jgi:arylsulfatase A-like enzyme
MISGPAFNFSSALRLLLLTCLGVLSSTSGMLASACQSQEPSQRRRPSPNVILIMADDLGWGDVGFNGNKIIQTPHLDAMARGGVVLKHFYAAAPVCSPTRGSVLTGRHPARYGIDFANTGHLPQTEFNIATEFQKAGYRTGHFGKWHLGTLTTTEPDANRGGPKNTQHFAPPQLRGFDVCFSTESKVPTFDPLVKPAGAGNTWWPALGKGEQRVHYGTAYWNEKGERITAGIEGDDSQLIVNRTTEFIRQCVSDERPFFAVVWFHAPHLPVVASAADRQPYSKWDNYAQHYFGCITAMDLAIGSLQASIESLGIAEQTLIAFCSDNGPEGQSRNSPSDHKRAPGSAGTFRGRKRDLFEGGVRVPSLLYWPGVIKPGTRHDPTSTLDYAPTLLEILGRSPSPERQLDGTSLKPLLDGLPLHRNQPIVFTSRQLAAIVDGEWKWVSRGNQPWITAGAPLPQQQEMLFHLKTDPNETTNVLEQHPERAAELKSVFMEFLRSAQRDRKEHGIQRGANEVGKKSTAP